MRVDCAAVVKRRGYWKMYKAGKENTVPMSGAVEKKIGNLLRLYMQVFFQFSCHKHKKIDDIHKQLLLLNL